MVYYNPEDEELDPPDLLFDVQNALDAITGFTDAEYSYPVYPISKEKELEICYKRQGLDELKKFIVEHRYEDRVVNLVDRFSCRMNIQAAKSVPGSEAYQLFCMMRDAAEEVAVRFL